jgi:hypothetical protein
VELDANFKIGQPIRQGDLLGFWDWRVRPPLARYGVIITADCDIANGRKDQELVYLRIIPQKDYVDAIWSRAKLTIARSKAFKDLAPQINRLRAQDNPSSVHLTEAEVQDWVASDAANNIADAIGVADESERSRLIRNIEQARTIMEFASAPVGSSCLDNLVKIRNQRFNNVLTQAANDLKSEHDELFFLTGLIHRDDDLGYYILLDQIGALARNQISDSMEAVTTGARASYRFGTLAQMYKYAVAQRFAFLGLQGIEWAILGGHSGGSMQVSTLRRRYSLSRSP